jgi:hypothetical protein
MLKCPAWRARSLGRRAEKRAYGIAERADLVEMGDGKATVAEALPFGLEPATEVLRGREQIHELPLADDHHGVREVDGEWLPEPAKDRASAPCWTESLHLTVQRPGESLMTDREEFVRR